jgi:FdhD protein
MLAEETPIALTYGRTTYAVMLATPADLADFAIGFSLNEGLIASPAEIAGLEVVSRPLGVELRMDLAGGRQDALQARRRHLTGATGCGLCGMESLEQASRPPPRVRATLHLSATEIAGAMAALGAAQPLNRQTHACHAAGFWYPSAGLAAVREDVGRHNALDKLAGWLAQSPHRAQEGVIVLTSRVSVEMVQKAATIGAPVLVAVSAPTALAIRTAEQAGITLVAVARADGFEVFTHAQRIVLTEPVDVA